MLGLVLAPAQAGTSTKFLLQHTAQIFCPMGYDHLSQCPLIMSLFFFSIISFVPLQREFVIYGGRITAIKFWSAHEIRFQALRCRRRPLKVIVVHVCYVYPYPCLPQTTISFARRSRPCSFLNTQDLHPLCMGELRAKCFTGAQLCATIISFSM